MFTTIYMNLQNQNTLKQISIKGTMQMWNSTSAASLWGMWLSKQSLTFMENFNLIISEFGVWLSVMFLATQFPHKEALLGGLRMSLVDLI